MSLTSETLRALDWTSVLEALASRCRTSMGSAQVPELALLTDVADIHEALDLTEEVLTVEADGGWIPVGEVGDCREFLIRAAKDGILTVDELRFCGLALRGLDDLCEYLQTREQDLPHLTALAPACRVDNGVLLTLAGAFDALGQLSARAYPELGELRDRISGLHQRIERTLQELVNGDTLSDALQDRYITQRGDRYVIPIKANHKRKSLGIVHGVSGSGQTAFVEPHQVVALNNELRLAEGELQATERRILGQLSRMVGRIADGALQGLINATTIDLAVARAGLARALEATRPHVGTSGVVRLVSARHPVLCLRGVDVVPNDLILTHDQPMLIVSGPNTGGKTVALKTLGLCALLARLGCYVPAAEDSRVDLFDHVVALIGDHQTVHGDHSSFSSHVSALSTMLDHAKRGCLYLIDEIASGTDPQQGAALAHALLEGFVDRGACGLVTTHFSRLKTLSALDNRFGIAALQFLNGQPTYRLITGSHGDSHALAIAARIGVPSDVVERARDLMGEGERNLNDLLEALDAERARADAAARQAETDAAELKVLRERVAAREAELKKRAKELEQAQAAAFLGRLDRAEKAVGQVVADLQRAPSHDAIRAARATIDAMRRLAPETPSQEAPPATQGPPKVGDRVKLLRMGSEGVVVTVKGKRLTVSVGTMTLRVTTDEVERLGGAPAPKPPKAKASAAGAKARPRQVALELDSAMRHAHNTLDLRGQRVDESFDEIEKFFDQATLKGLDVVFILHGHGTGVLKKGIRTWLRKAPHVQQWKPANPDQGGDAYTIIALR